MAIRSTGVMLMVVLVVPICSDFPQVVEAESGGGAMQHSRGNQIVMSPSGSKSTPIASPSGEKKEKKIEKKEEKKEETPK